MQCMAAHDRLFVPPPALPLPERFGESCQVTSPKEELYLDTPGIFLVASLEDRVGLIQFRMQSRQPLT